MTVETKIEKKDFIKLMYIMVYRKPIVIFLNLIGILMIIGSVSYILGFKDLFDEPPYFQSVFGLFITILLPLSVWKSAVKNFSSNGRLKEGIIYQFTDSSISIQGNSFKSEMDWKKTYKVIELKKWILIYQNKLVFNVIPKESFGSNLQDFKDLVRKNKIKFRFKNN